MIDEQKFPIPLNSPLDINSNDMLVPAANPKFAFNRQRYLGSLLQTSVRYESDGWFAGWWDHDFKIASTGRNGVWPSAEPKPEILDPIVVYTRYASDGSTYYVVQWEDEDIPINVRVDISGKEEITWINGDEDNPTTSTIARNGDNVTITGKSRLGNNFSFTMNILTGTVVDFDDIDKVGLKVQRVTKDYPLWHVTIDRDYDATTSNDWVKLRKARNISINNTTLIYSYDTTNMSRWAGIFELNNDSSLADNGLVALDTKFSDDYPSEFTIVPGSTTIEDLAGDDEHVQASIVDNTIGQAKFTFNLKDYWTRDLFQSVQPQAELIGGTSVDDPINRSTTRLLDTRPGGWNYASEVDIAQMLPIWMKVQSNWNFMNTFPFCGYPAERDFEFIITPDVALFIPGDLLSTRNNEAASPVILTGNPGSYPNNTGPVGPPVLVGRVTLWVTTIFSNPEPEAARGTDQAWTYKYIPGSNYKGKPSDMYNPPAPLSLYTSFPNPATQSAYAYEQRPITTSIRQVTGSTTLWESVYRINAMPRYTVFIAALPAVMRSDTWQPYANFPNPAYSPHYYDLAVTTDQLNIVQRAGFTLRTDYDPIRYVYNSYKWGIHADNSAPSNWFTTQAKLDTYTDVQLRDNILDYTTRTTADGYQPDYVLYTNVTQILNPFYQNDPWAASGGGSAPVWGPNPTPPPDNIWIGGVLADNYDPLQYLTVRTARTPITDVSNPNWDPRTFVWSRPVRGDVTIVLDGQTWTRNYSSLDTAHNGVMGANTPFRTVSLTFSNIELYPAQLKPDAVHPAGTFTVQTFGRYYNQQRIQVATDFFELSSYWGRFYSYMQEPRLINNPSPMLPDNEMQAALPVMSWTINTNPVTWVLETEVDEETGEEIEIRVNGPGSPDLPPNSVPSVVYCDMKFDLTKGTIANLHNLMMHTELTPSPGNNPGGSSFVGPLIRWKYRLNLYTWRLTHTRQTMQIASKTIDITPSYWIEDVLYNFSYPDPTDKDSKFYSVRPDRWSRSRFYTSGDDFINIPDDGIIMEGQALQAMVPPLDRRWRVERGTYYVDEVHLELKAECANTNWPPIDQSGTSPYNYYFIVDLNTDRRFFSTPKMNGSVDTSYGTWETFKKTITFGRNLPIFRVYNLFDLEDPNLNRYNDSSGDVILTIPLCVPAFAMTRVKTVDILRSSINAFKTERLSASDPKVVDEDYNYAWRIDGSGVAPDPVDADQYHLNMGLVKAITTSVIGTGNVRNLYVTLESSNPQGVPFYVSKVQNAVYDEDTGALKHINQEIYPQWITSDAVSAKFLATDTMDIYVAGENTQTAANLTVSLEIGNFIIGVSYGFSTNKTTPYNTELFNDIEQYAEWTSYLLSQYDIWEDKNGNVVPAGDPAADHLDKAYQQYVKLYDLADHTWAGTDPNWTPGYLQTWFRLDVSAKIQGGEIEDVVTQEENNYPNTPAYPYKLLTDDTATLKLQYTYIPSEFTATVLLQNTTEQVLNFYRVILLASNGIMVPVSIQEQRNQLVTLEDVAFPDDDYGDVDMSTGILDGATKVTYINTLTEVDDNSNTIHTVYVVTNNSAVFRFIPTGIVYSDILNLKWVATTTDTSYIITDVTYGGIGYTIQIDRKSKTTLEYTTLDIRNNEYKQVYNRDVADCYMFIKQFWSNTVDVENYWWVDNTHVLSLTKDDMILYVKNPTLGVHDWMGDRWDIEQSVPRSVFITTDDLYYGVSNTLNDMPVFYKLQATGNTIEVVFIRDIVACNFEDPWYTKDSTYFQHSLPVAKVKLGTNLRSTSSLNAYSNLNPAALIAASKISATVVDGIFILGIAYTKGLKQWSILMDGSTLKSVVIGYGHVGVDGSLTGGALPINVVDTTGFKEVVWPLSDLSKIKDATIPSKCYGNESSVWFIYNRIEGIVSHMVWASGGHTPVPLSLNNNIESQYESMSFSADALLDISLQELSITALFEDALNSILSIIADIALPAIFVMAPKYVMACYINHSLGQYAYVYRNTRQEKVDDTVTDQDLTFGLLTRNITMTSLSDSNKSFIWAELILKGIQTIDSVAVDYTANGAMNQTSPDKKSWSSFFVDNVASTVSTALTATGMIFSLKSTLTQKYALNMFYNISDKSQISAGPGYTELDFIGQCVAQSVTDTQVEIKRIAYWVTLKSLSILVIKFKIYGFTMARDLLLSGIEGLGSVTAGSNPGPIIPLGSILIAAMNVAAAALNILIAINQAAIDAMDGLCDALGPSIGTASNNGGVAKRDLRLEMTHAYGNKNMTFMWPAWGINTPNTYTDEQVVVGYVIDGQDLNMSGRVTSKTLTRKPFWTLDNNDAFIGSSKPFKGTLYTVSIKCKGMQTTVTAPEDMAVLEGTTAFLPQDLFKNEQIGVEPPTFAPPNVFDYIVNKQWKLSYTTAGGFISYVSCDDTKVIDGSPSNIVVTDTFCGIASTYTAIEIKDLFDIDYLRPVALTPTAIALNLNRINVVHNAKAYHAFDGYGNRIVSWTGGSGMDKALLWQQYQFQINDHFKRSNILPPSQFFGDFSGPPNIAVRAYDRVANLVQSLAKVEGITNDIPGENKSLQRFSIPIHSEPLSSLPAMIRTLAPYKLSVVEGITSLTTDLRTTRSAYKAPTSTDFNINGKPYRATEEFICEITQAMGANAVQDIVASVGLTFIGATTKEAFFYSPATRMYYSFSGNRDITKRDIFNRFKDIKEGRWDFVNQEVMFKCMLGDEIVVLRLDGSVLGEVTPPNKTIYDDESDFKLLSMAGGTVYQGPKRFIISRFITLDNMFDDIRTNATSERWTKLSRDDYYIKRDYLWQYEDLSSITPTQAISGWTHNPFRLVTSMLGIDEETDCKFEWELTFAWTEQMDKLFKQNEYATVNLMSETVTEGGTLVSKITHIFLFKELFTRAGSAGYYTFKFQGGNGIGNRERLYIWSDSFIALEDLQLYCKNMTAHRTQPLVSQLDVQKLTEL
jgi:hypothetical protein